MSAAELDEEPGTPAATGPVGVAELTRALDGLQRGERRDATLYRLERMVRFVQSNGDAVLETLDGIMDLPPSRVGEYVQYERRMRTLLGIRTAVSGPALKHIDRVYEEEVAHGCFVCSLRFVSNNELNAHMRERHPEELAQKLNTLCTLATSVSEHAAPLYKAVPRLERHVEEMMEYAVGERLLEDDGGFLTAARNFLEVLCVKLSEHLGLADTTAFLRLDDFLVYLKSKLPPVRINPFYAAKEYSSSSASMRARRARTATDSSGSEGHNGGNGGGGGGGNGSNGGEAGPRPAWRSSLEAASLTLHALHQSMDEAKSILRMPAQPSDAPASPTGTPAVSVADEDMSPSHLLGSLHKDMGVSNMSLFESMLPSQSNYAPPDAAFLGGGNGGVGASLGAASVGKRHTDLSHDWQVGNAELAAQRAKELKALAGGVPISGSSVFPSSNEMSLTHSLAHNPTHHLYKTMLCKHWESSATCPRGSECNFAHGQVELRRARCKFYPLGKCKAATDAARSRWYLLDARRVPAGRLAVQIAHIIQGKHKPIYDPSVDVGDNVVVINARDITLTGRKMRRKLYRWHTGYPGGLVERTGEELHARQADKILWKAIYGMLPKNRLRRVRMQRVRIYESDSHPHHGLIQSIPRHLEPRLSTRARLARGILKETDEERETRLRETPGYIVWWEKDSDGNLVVRRRVQQPDRIPKRPRGRAGLYKRGDAFSMEEGSTMKPVRELPMFQHLLGIVEKQEAEAKAANGDEETVERGADVKK